MKSLHLAEFPIVLAAVLTLHVFLEACTPKPSYYSLVEDSLDETDGVKAVFYQVDMEMIDLENNVKAWFGQKKLKKVIERRRTLF